MPKTNTLCTANRLRLRASWRRWYHCVSGRRPIAIFTHHKTGTVLMANVFHRVASHLNLNMYEIYGRASRPLIDKTVTLFDHSQFAECVLARDFRGVHVRRDPRDIVVSGYLYHLRCNEPWCVALPGTAHGTVDAAVIPYEMEEADSDWKNQYISELAGRSYQATLTELEQEEGLLWELEHCARWTIEALQEWDYGDSRILEVKLEDIVADFGGEFSAIFAHLGYSEQLSGDLHEMIRHQDMGAMSGRMLEKNQHISGRSVSKWEQYFTPRVTERFDQLFPDIVRRLGYD